MPRIVIEIKTCKECPYWKEGNYSSTDGWDRGADWSCTKMNDKVIQGFVEWHEEKKVPVPEWCPCAIDLKKERKLKLEKLDNNE